MVVTLGNIAIEDRTVSIYGGVSDAADCCAVTHCKFYDVSPGRRYEVQAGARAGAHARGVVGADGESLELLKKPG